MLLTPVQVCIHFLWGIQCDTAKMSPEGKALLNIVILGFGFMFMFTAFQTCGNIEVGLNFFPRLITCTTKSLSPVWSWVVMLKLIYFLYLFSKPLSRTSTALISMAADTQGNLAGLPHSRTCYISYLNSWLMLFTLSAAFLQLWLWARPLLRKCNQRGLRHHLIVGNQFREQSWHWALTYQLSWGFQKYPSCCIWLCRCLFLAVSFSFSFFPQRV